MLNKPIIIVSGDSIPLIDGPVSGAGLRAWGLGEALRLRGFHVIYALLDQEKKYQNLPENIMPFQSKNLNDLLVSLNPQTVVFQHWPLMLSLPKTTSFPIALDFHGPLLIEMAYQERSDYNYFLENKISALSRADFFSCAGFNQQHYFRSWLIAAGFDIRENIPHIIPISLPPMNPIKDIQDELIFVFGGYFLPWQNPSSVLFELADLLQKYNTGKLLLFGGNHPGNEIPVGIYEELYEKLNSNNRVFVMGMMSRKEVLKHYINAHIAVDLMNRNPERELAFTTRTVEYFNCGLAVIYNNYSDISSFIDKYDAGWIIDPSDKTAIRATLQNIFLHPEIVKRKMKGALKLAQTEFDWEKTIEPLALYCSNPEKRLPLRKAIHAISKQKTIHISNEGNFNSNETNELLSVSLKEINSLKGQLKALKQELINLRVLENRLHNFIPYKIYKKIKSFINK